MKKDMVCVTGAGGYIGSYLVKILLENGYTVHATLRDPGPQLPQYLNYSISGLVGCNLFVGSRHIVAGNSDKSSPLLALPGANERLRLFKADLNHEGSFDAAIHGCQGVFSVASPIYFGSQAPEDEIIEPAIRGTLNVLQSCVRAKSVKRVVYTSSSTAAFGTEELKDPVDESCWTSVELLRNSKSYGLFYGLTTTLSEKAALQFGRENHIEVVSIVPAIVVGPSITKAVPFSVQFAMSLITGNQEGIEFLKSVQLSIKCVSLVHIEDVCNAHVYLMEQPQAEERYICSAHNTTLSDLADFISKRYPRYNITTKFEDLVSSPGGAVLSKDVVDLGFRYKYGLDEIMDHSIQYFQKLGILD